jgi:hypothetical protein
VAGVSSVVYQEEGIAVSLFVGRCDKLYFGERRQQVFYRHVRPLVMKEVGEGDEFSPPVPVRFFEVDGMAVEHAIILSAGLSQSVAALVHNDTQKPSRQL